MGLRFAAARLQLRSTKAQSCRSGLSTRRLGPVFRLRPRPEVLPAPVAAPSADPLTLAARTVPSAPVPLLCRQEWEPTFGSLAFQSRPLRRCVFSFCSHKLLLRLQAQQMPLEILQ